MRQPEAQNPEPVFRGLRQTEKVLNKNLNQLKFLGGRAAVPHSVHSLLRLEWRLGSWGFSVLYRV